MAKVRVSFDLDTERFSAADAEKIIKAEILRAAVEDHKRRFQAVRADASLEGQKKSLTMAEHLLATKWALQAEATMVVEELPETVEA